MNRKHQIIIYSPAIPKTNPELLRAKELKIPTMSYPQALGELGKGFFTIAVAGSHGKSTTTALTALALKNIGPTVVIGTKMKEFGGQNYKVGKSKYLILEACEYKNSFLSIKPEILVITNIEAEHLDFFKNSTNYFKTFEKLIKNVPKNGTIIVNPKERGVAKILKKLKNDPRIVKITVDTKIKPSVPGDFNIRNANLAAKVGELLDVPKEKIKKHIKLFKGTWRRLEKKRKKLGKCTFIDDYAHHPTEIELTLKAIRETYPESKILCVFQPHQYSRTKLLLKEFGKCFFEVDKVLIPNIYKVRDSEKDVKSVKVKDLVEEIKKNGTKALDGKTIEKSAQFIKKNHKEFDVIVTMGAGNIGEIYKQF